jgi:hypothetical protein
MAPSRLLAKAMSAILVSRNEKVKIRLARKTGAKATTAASR